MLRTIGHGAAHHGAGGGPAYLNSVLASTIFDLDATVAASYPGTGTTWANLVATPADGAAQTAYDFYRGDGATSSTYPTHTGPAGSAAAYWAFDGGDFFNLKSGSNTNFLKSLHKTTGGTPSWIAVTYRIPDLAGNAGLFNNTASGGNGLSFNFTSGETGTLFVLGDGAGSTSVGTGVSGIATDTVLIISINPASNVATYWRNTTTGTATTPAFSTATTDADNIFQIAARFFNSTLLANGSRMYSFAMGNEYLDNTKAAAIIAHLESRHGRDYTP